MTVTLDDLRAQFEAAETAYEARYLYGMTFSADNWVADMADPANGDDEAICELELACRIAARRFIIARDFNEFDPKRADMLFKLTYGGAQ